MLAVPERYVRLSIDAPPYEPRCGRRALERALRGRATPELAEVFTQPCFRLAPGAHCEIHVRFAGGGEAPRGNLRLTVDRGRLERSEIELDGSQDELAIGYDAPDETIRISVRAFLDGHARGKAHLHLVPEA
jgi:hypothetical protein